MRVKKYIPIIFIVIITSAFGCAKNDESVLSNNGRDGDVYKYNVNREDKKQMSPEQKAFRNRVEAFKAARIDKSNIQLMTELESSIQQLAPLLPNTSLVPGELKVTPGNQAAELTSLLWNLDALNKLLNNPENKQIPETWPQVINLSADYVSTEEMGLSLADVFLSSDQLKTDLNQALKINSILAGYKWITAAKAKETTVTLDTQHVNLERAVEILDLLKVEYEANNLYLHSITDINLTSYSSTSFIFKIDASKGSSNDFLTTLQLKSKEFEQLKQLAEQVSSKLNVVVKLNFGYIYSTETAGQLLNYILTQSNANYKWPANLEVHINNHINDYSSFISLSGKVGEYLESKALIDKYLVLKK